MVLATVVGMTMVVVTIVMLLLLVVEGREKERDEG